MEQLVLSSTFLISIFALLSRMGMKMQVFDILLIAVSFVVMIKLFSVIETEPQSILILIVQFVLFMVCVISYSFLVSSVLSRKGGFESALLFAILATASIFAYAGTI